MIDNIVVTAVDTTTVGARFQRMLATGVADIGAQDSERPRFGRFKVKSSGLRLGKIVREGAHV